MQDLIISPSILSLDYAKVSEQLAALERSNAKWLHFDVMDAHFVPNLTFGPDVCKGCASDGCGPLVCIRFISAFRGRTD